MGSRPRPLWSPPQKTGSCSTLDLLMEKILFTYLFTYIYIYIFFFFFVDITL